MKIRADFVTNSSSSSYVDIYADNPVLNELLEKYNGSTNETYMHFTTDWCDEHENLEYSNSLLEFLNLIGGNDKAIQEELKEKEALLLSGFRYAKYNTGFHYTDGYLSGEEHHVTLSSRWGVFDQHTWIDENKANNEDDDEDDEEDNYDDDENDDEDNDDSEDEYDEDEYDEEEYDETDDEDDENDENEYENLVPNLNHYEEYWEKIKTDRKEKPIEAIAGFAGARPDDLEKRTDLSDKQKLVVNNLNKEPVEIKDKKFVFIGDYNQYVRLASGDGSEEDEEESWDDWDDDNTDPWDDREYSHVVNGNIPEIGLISLWLSPLGGKIKSIGRSGRIGTADYVVVRMDSWAEQCIDTDVIQEAVEKGIPIISEYQLWKAIFN